jgi:hypothetical protein
LFDKNNKKPQVFHLRFCGGFSKRTIMIVREEGASLFDSLESTYKVGLPSVGGFFISSPLLVSEAYRIIQWDQIKLGIKAQKKLNFIVRKFMPILTGDCN